MPFGNAVVVICRGNAWLIVMLRDGETPESPPPSVTRSVNVEVPNAVGVPLIVTELPLLAARLRPAGSEPDATEKM